MKNKKRILGVKVFRLLDEAPDTSLIGEYTDKPSPWAIVRETGEYIADMKSDEELPRVGREYRYFLPVAGDEKPGSKAYKKYGLQDFKRMESLARGDWNFFGIRAEATIQLAGDLTQKITSGGLWGIESDSDPKYFQEIAKDELNDLKTELLAMGFQEKEIPTWDGEFEK